MDRPLRLLLVTNMYPTAASPAFGSFVRDQVEALRATGEVDVRVFAFDARRRPWRYLTNSLRLAGPPPGVDLVHAHYGLSGLACLTLPRDLPLVLTLHGRDCHHPIVKRLTTLAARRARATIAVSRELAAHCPFPVSDVIPPGVDLTVFHPLPRREARRQLGIDEGQRLLLFAADPNRPEKRYDRAQALIRALGGQERRVAAENWPARVRSPGEAPPLGATSQPVRGSETGVALWAVSGRPHDEMALWFNAADAVVVTSEREGYGLVCVEALACDTPVFSTSVGIARELLPRVPGTFCAPFELDTWTSRLRTLLADADPHVAGREIARTHGLDFVAQRLLVLYRRLV